MRNVHDLGLELECLAHKEHRLHRPLCVDILFMDLVKMQSLRLLAQSLAFSDIREEELLSEVRSIAMLIKGAL